MYISCDIPNGGPLEPETGYVPNNPLFGLPLDSPQSCSASCAGCVSCQGSLAVISTTVDGSDFDCGNCLDHNGALSSGNSQNTQSGLNNSYWSSEDMASTFPGLPPLDIDPLPSLFPFSPCGAAAAAAAYNFSAPQASLSYTVHPQVLVSPNHHHHHHSSATAAAAAAAAAVAAQSQSQNISSYGGSQSYYDSSCNQHTSPSIYPSMSVNVSMNMTMHGYGSDAPVPVQCSQMQWPSQNATSSVNVLYPPLLSPSHYTSGGSSAYSFAPDFRSPTSSNGNSTAVSSAVTSISSTINSTTNSISNQIGNSGHESSSSSKSEIPQRNFQISTTPICSLSAKSPTYPQTSKDTSKASYSIGFDEDDSSDGFSNESKPNLCRLCGKTYARPSTLKTHLRTHSGERPYRCPDCNKSFSQAANLTAHVRTHTGQKPFRCPICDRRFSQSSSVTTHMRTHSGERPYRCRACKKAFSDSSTLTKHLRIHSGEKPYQCKLCLLRFSQSGNLNRHMRVHGTNGTGT